MTYPIAKRNIAGLMGGRHAQLVETTMIWSGTSTGSANAQVIAPEFTADMKGHPTYVFVAGYTNTGATTLSADGGVTNTSLRKPDGTALIGGEIVAGTAYAVVYDGTYWRLIGGAGGEDTATSIAAASTVNIGGTSARAITVTSGTGPITAWGTAPAGAHRDITFATTVTLTYNATSAILTGGGDIIATVGDTCRMESLGSGNWKMLSFQRVTGNALGAYTTQALSASDKSSNATLSNSNRTVTTADGSVASGRASNYITTPTYWEVLIVTVGTSNVGVAGAVAPTSDYLTNSAYGWGYLSSGNKATNGGATSFGSSWTSGDRLCFAYHPGTRNLWMGKVVGGVPVWGASGDPVAGTNPAYTTTSGTAVFPSYSVNGSGGSVTFSFAGGTLTAAPPTGFTAFN